MKVLIINFNRLTLPRNMADWVVTRGCDPIFIDNNSDYLPLLEYYKNCPYQVLRMDKNYGHTVVWDQNILDKLGIEGNYILTDPDLDLTGIPDDFLVVLEEGLRKYPHVDKCGFSLEIDNLPRTKFSPIEHEKQFWETPLDDYYFNAAIDTTFALYKVRHHSLIGIRTNRPYTAKHVPWYYSNIEDIPKDEQYYFNTTLYLHILGGIEERITALTINYNTPDLLEKLLISFRQFYNISYIVIDGSDNENYEKIKDFPNRFNIELIHFDYNIHHGPGMAYGINYIKTKQILLLDSDVFILKSGFVEDLRSKLRLDSYGIGDISIIDERGVNAKEGIKYLHPSCALINREIARQYALPAKHGAPMIEAMKDIHNKKADILQHEPWVANDLMHSLHERDDHKNNIYIVHMWSGTCGRVGGMNL